MWGTFEADTLHWGDTLLKRTTITGALILATALLTFSSFGAHAGAVVYRWKDAAGNPVNSDRPPPQGTDYEVISTTSSMVRPVDAQEGAVPLQVKPTANNDFKPVEADKPAVEKNPEYCQRAKDNLLQIDSHGRIRLRDDQGEVRYLTEEEKEAERKNALDAMKVFCK
jgi:hypothetical protein